jgi:hypothetical protein
MDDGPPTVGQLFTLGMITAAFPVVFLFVVQFIQAPQEQIADNVLFAFQEIGADSAVVLIGVSFFLAAAGDLAVGRAMPSRWHLIIALAMSCGLILLLVITQGNQVRSLLQSTEFLLRWTFIQGTATIIALFYGALLKSLSHGG